MGEDKRRERSDIRPTAVRMQLEHVAREGEFELLIVADQEGYLVGWSVDETRYDDIRVQKFADLSRRLKPVLDQHLDLEELRETDFLLHDGRRVVSRFFEWRGQELGLIGVTRTAELYSELIDRVVTGVQRILTQG